VISIIIISRDEPDLDGTLTDVARQAETLDEQTEIIVVDSSEGRLDHIRRRHEADVRWVQYQQPPGVAVSIPHQRNAGVRTAGGEIIVFTDAGCRPKPGWLASLVAPLLQDEHITAGSTLATDGVDGLYDRASRQSREPGYLSEAPTINLAFRRQAFDATGGFDEGFAYGSDIDFTWRLTDLGYRIRSVPEAVIRHDWGTRRRQLRRSYVYGKARLRLYRKHRTRRKHVLRNDPIVVVYPAFLLGLPLVLFFPLFPPSLLYPALLLIPAWRNRAQGPARVLMDHLSYGAGVLAELVAR
jgi:GT2 family glycosyltransferase